MFLQTVRISFYSLANKKNLDRSNLKAFVEEKNNVIEFKTKVFLVKGKNILGKGENGGYQEYSFSQNFFKSLFQDHLKSGLCSKELSCCSKVDHIQV